MNEYVQIYFICMIRNISHLSAASSIEKPGRVPEVTPVKARCLTLATLLQTLPGVSSSSMQCGPPDWVSDS